MNPNALKQLAVIIKQGSISSASEQLFVTQPTLTRAIKQLEQKVGAPVLTRTRYGVVATEIGERLGKIGEKILLDAEQGEEVIRQWHSGFHNEFSIGIDPLWEYAAAQQTTHAFLQDPRYVFHLRTGSAAAQIELLQQGELDFIIGPAHLTVAQKGLHREVLFRDRAAIFAGAKSALLKQKRAITTNDLSKSKWFIAGANAGFMNHQHNVAPNNAAKISFTGSIHSVMSLLSSSDMLVQLPARLALMSGALQSEQMLNIEDMPDQPRRDIALWSRNEETERPDAQQIRRLICDFLRDLDQNTSEYGLEL